MTDDLISNLKVSSKRWATAITQEANKNLGKFRSLIKVSSKTVEDSGKIGVVPTGTSTNKLKPVARAYEYGSGIRSRSKKKSPHQLSTGGKILIKPKSPRKYLAFVWDKAIANPRKSLFVKDKKIFQGGVDDIPAGARILLGSVQHPGVLAANSGKGYLAPAIAKVRRQIRKDIPKDVRKAFLGTFRKSFGVSKK